MDLVEVEMRRLPFRIRVIGRILYGREIMHIHIERHDDNTARMLSGRSLDPLAPFGKIGALSFRERLGDSHFLLVAAHKAIRGLFLHRTDCSGTEHMILAENLFRIGMGIGLVFS